ncbi:MAG: hypothetical protein WCC04_20790 [Terriglobales bacterium]
MRFPKSSLTKKVNVSSSAPTIVRKLSKAKERIVTEEAAVIRLSAKDAVNGFALLLNKGQVQALPNDSYVVGPEHMALLDDAGIQYDVVVE